MMVKELKILCIGSLAVFLAACADQELPIALEMVNSEEESLATGNTDTKVESRTLIETIVKNGVPKAVARKGLAKFDQFKAKVKRKDKFILIDFTQHSRRKRMFLVERKSGKVKAIATSHGVGSDPERTDRAHYFSNVPNSRMTSLGAYIVNEPYTGKYGASLRMDGLEATNSNARKRAIVIHPAQYVQEGADRQGLSWGCPAVSYDQIEEVIERAQRGTFLYAFGKNKAKVADYETMKYWDNLPSHLWVDESETD